jgi:hypothetical protein
MPSYAALHSASRTSTANAGRKTFVAVSPPGMTRVLVSSSFSRPAESIFQQDTACLRNDLVASATSEPSPFSLNSTLSAERIPPVQNHTEDTSWSDMPIVFIASHTSLKSAAVLNSLLSTHLPALTDLYVEMSCSPMADAKWPRTTM